ncbi:hypothetical protein [Dysgonomonas reticulitermitis]
MTKFNLIMGILGEITAILLGIMLLAWTNSTGLGLVFLVSGIILLVVNIMKLQTHNEELSDKEAQMNFIQNRDSVPELKEPVTVSVKISDSLREEKYNIFSDGVKKGKIVYGEVLKFDVTKEKSLIEAGIGDTPFPTTHGYLFDASSNTENVALEVASKNCAIVLKRIF